MMRHHHNPGLCTTLVPDDHGTAAVLALPHPEVINADLLAFVQGKAVGSAPVGIAAAAAPAR